MLSSVSWQQYLAAIAIFSAFYYLYVLFRYYQLEIRGLFQFRQDNPTVQQPVKELICDVMGPVKEVPHVKIIDERELHFAEAESDEQICDKTYETTTPQERLIAETDKLVAEFGDVDSKSEFITLFKILLSSYDHYQTAVDYSEVKVHLLSRPASDLPFELKAEDISFDK